MSNGICHGGQEQAFQQFGAKIHPAAVCPPTDSNRKARPPVAFINAVGLLTAARVGTLEGMTPAWYGGAVTWSHM
jgi:hypothetical protein